MPAASPPPRPTVCAPRGPRRRARPRPWGAALSGLGAAGGTVRAACGRPARRGAGAAGAVVVPSCGPGPGLRRAVPRRSLSQEAVPWWEEDGFAPSAVTAAACAWFLGSR